MPLANSRSSSFSRLSASARYSFSASRKVARWRMMNDPLYSSSSRSVLKSFKRSTTKARKNASDSSATLVLFSSSVWLLQFDNSASTCRSRRTTLSELSESDFSNAGPNSRTCSNICSGIFACSMENQERVAILVATESCSS